MHYIYIHIHTIMRIHTYRHTYACHVFLHTNLNTQYIHAHAYVHTQRGPKPHEPTCMHLMHAQPNNLKHYVKL